MTATKARVRQLLHGLHLYEPAHALWIRRPDLRLSTLNMGYRLVGTDDGLAIPPTDLMRLATLSGEVSWFLKGGRMARDGLLFCLRRNAFRFEDFDRVLDFGCGCGRVMRHWLGLRGPQLYGTDYNPKLVQWCQKHLGRLAEFSTNGLEPPLVYPQAYFDFVYALSVFTHLTEELQPLWMKEIHRVLKDEGVVLFTVHGASRLDELDPEEQRRFRAGQLVLRHPKEAGSNVCGAYHPERYVRDVLAQGFCMQDFVEVGARDSNQDIYLMEKQT